MSGSTPHIRNIIDAARDALEPAAMIGGHDGGRARHTGDPRHLGPLAGSGDRKMRGAGLDVFEQEPVDPNNPLLKMDNVVVSPHLAGGSTRSMVLAPHRAAAQVAAVLRGQWPMAGQNPEVRANIALRQNATAVAP